MANPIRMDDDDYVDENAQQTAAQLAMARHDGTPNLDDGVIIDIASWPVKRNVYQPGQTTNPFDDAEILPNQKEEL